MSLTLAIPTVSAAGPMQIEWEGDYSDMNNPKLIVNYVSPARYRHQVTAVIYDADTANPSLNDYIRMNEESVLGDRTNTFEYKITSIFDESDYHYKLGLQGSGYMAEELKEIVDVYVLNSTDAKTALSECLSNDSASLASALTKVNKALQLDNFNDITASSSQIAIMKNVKADDFDNTFANLNVVADAWNVSNALNNINNAASGSDVTQILDAEAELFGLNNLNETIAEDLSNNLDAVGSGLTNGDPITGNDIMSIKSLNNAIGNYLGVEMINNDANSGDELLDIFDTYKGYLGLDSASLEAYDDMTPTQKGQVLESIRDNMTEGGYATDDAINSVFVAKVEDVVKNAGTSTGGGTGGGGGGGGGGGASITPSKNPSGNVTGSKPDATQPSDETDPTGEIINEPVDEKVTSFNDVSSSHWANEYINELIKLGVLNGYDDGSFRPNNNVTREEFVKIIVTTCGIYDVNASCEFDDMTEDSWFYKQVASAVARGIINGMDDGGFGVGQNITRQDAAVIISRTIESLIGAQTTPAASTLTDYDSVSDYAKEAVALLQELGIINGYDDGTYLPFGSLTRAEAAAIMSKLLDVI